MDRRYFLKNAVLLAGGLIVSGPLASYINAANKAIGDSGLRNETNNKNNMNILIIESSPHKHGSSNILAENFAKGAREKGHTVDIFDAGHSSIHPCLGCNACDANGPCVQKDDYENKLKPMIKSHDVIAFVTPLYYYGFSSQMKMVIDRFYSFNFELMDMKKKSVLICAGEGLDDDTFPAIKAHYDKICRYLNFHNLGMILGLECGTPSLTSSSEWPGKAYEFGKSL